MQLMVTTALSCGIVLGRGLQATAFDGGCIAPVVMGHLAAHAPFCGMNLEKVALWHAYGYATRRVEVRESMSCYGS